jgi:predicted SnoaL-like aldol condensation-catalyzing enzyme
MPKTRPEQNKALVLDAFDTLFNKRDYATAERFWSLDYIQHSAHITPGREGLFNLIKSIPTTLKYEPGTIVAEGDFVIVHWRFSDFGAPANWIAADIVRVEAGTQLPAPEFPNYAAGSEPTSWHELLGISGNTAKRAIG